MQATVTTFRATFNCDRRIMQITTNYSRNKTTRSTIMNLQAKNLKKIDNFFVNFEFKLPSSPTDQEFKKIIMRTEVNYKRALEGDFDTNLSEAFVKQVLKSLNFKLELPLKPVGSFSYLFIELTFLGTN